MVQELGAVLRTVEPRLLYNYIMWRVVMDLVPFLPPPYQVISFSLHTPPNSASKSSIRRFVITEKAPTRAFSWLKAATTAFAFKTLLRHYAKCALTPW